jgi:hypothetical protein
MTNLTKVDHAARRHRKLEKLECSSIIKNQEYADTKVFRYVRVVKSKREAVD